MSQNLLDEISRTVELLSALGDVAAVERFSRLRDLWGTTQLNVVVFGAFNRGKSTLINALLGELILPAKLVPTTGHITRLRYGPRREVCVQLSNGTQEICRLEDLDNFSLLANQQARDDVELIEVRCPSPILERGVALIDTPGIQDSDAQTRRAERAVAQSHLLLMVLDAQHLLPEWEKIQANRFAAQLGKPLILVVNKMNLLDPVEQGEARSRVERWSRTYVPVEIMTLGRSFLEVNALGALRHELNIGPPPADDFAALRRLLAEINLVYARELQTRGNCGVLKSEVVQTRANNDREIWRLREAAEQVERERSEQLRMLAVRQEEYRALAEAGAETILHFARQQLQPGAATAGGRACAIPLTKLREIDAEAGRLAAEIEQGLLAEPLPFTLAEELQSFREPAGLAPEIAFSQFRVHALARLQAQWQMRSSEVQRGVCEKLAELQARPRSCAEELRWRQSLDGALARVHRDLRGVERLAGVSRRAFELSLTGGKSPEACWEMASESIAEDLESGESE
jgi:small GTP-binding protein